MGIRSSFTVLLVCLALSWPGSANASPWARTLEAGIKALRTGRVEVASRAFEGCLPFASKTLENNELLFHDFLAVATAYQSHGDLPTAASWAQRALAGMEALRGPNHPNLVQPLTVLAAIRLAQNDVDEAARLVKRACDLSWKRGRKPDERLSAVVGMTSRALTTRRRQADADSLLAALVGPGTAAPAARLEGPGTPAPTARPTEYPAYLDGLRRYARARKDLIQEKAKAGPLQAWFRTTAESVGLAPPEGDREALRAQALDHWKKYVDFVDSLATCRACLDAVTRADEMASDRAAAERKWLDEHTAAVERVEADLNFILGKTPPSSH